MIGNAIKFTAVGSVRVLLSFEKNQSLTIDVIDTGIGIHGDKLEKVFEMFVQADGTITRRYGGTGIGLALSRKLAQAMGGDLKIVSSVAGQGTTFRITIPNVRNESSEGSILTSENTAADSRTRVSLTGMKILVVDDSEDNRQLIVRHLNKKGALVETAVDGKAGMEKALAADFDIIVMDLQMPVMDGYTATKLIREAGIKTPIIALTAHAMRDVRQETLDAGFSDYLTKPIDFAKLGEALTLHFATQH